MNPVETVLEQARSLEADQRARAMGDEEIIPRCIQMLEIIRGRPELRPSFAEAFRTMWRGREYGWEPIMFCMRVLQWPELEEFFRGIHADAVARQDFRGEPCARAVLEAFGDAWDESDDELYRPLEELRNQSANKAS